MPDAPPPPNQQFWLLTGEVPTGPFSVDQVHAKIAAGDATWQTPACPVGGGNWLPIVRTPGLGPVAPEANAPAGEPTESAAPKLLPPPQEAATAQQGVGGTPPLPFTPNPPGVHAISSEPVPADPKSELVGVGIGIAVLLLALAGVGYGVYWAYERLRADTATDVCKKMDEAKTAAEAKAYATPRMHPLLDAMFAAGAPNPNDHSEWTQEIDGPRPDTKLVGFRGTYFVPAAGRRVRIEGHFVVVKEDGWKADDTVITGVEGVSLPGPVSLVDEHRASLTPPKAATPGGTAVPGSKTRPFVPGQSGPPVRSEMPRYKRPIEKAFISLKDAIGWGGIVGIVVVLIVGCVIRESMRKKSTPS